MCSSVCQRSLANVKVASGKAPIIGARLFGNRIEPKLGPCDESVIRNKEAAPRPLCATHVARWWTFQAIFQTVSLSTYSYMDVRRGLVGKSCKERTYKYNLSWKLITEYE
jgi:hypothetical protein